MLLVEGGGYAELVAVRATQAVRVPDNIDLIEAGGIPEVFITAHDALFTRGHLGDSETVLVHGGGGGVGTAAIQLAHQHGCRVLVTAGSAEKLERCIALGADAGINYRTEDFVARTRELTDGQGVDVVLDIMGASYLGRNIDAVGLDGRVVVIGMQGGTHGDLDLGAMMRRRISLDLHLPAVAARQLRRPRSWPHSPPTSFRHSPRGLAGSRRSRAAAH